jgi:tungstate transport system substrate-binding protein
MRWWLVLVPVMLAGCAAAATPTPAAPPSPSAPSSTSPAALAVGTARPGHETVLLATTTSVQDSGLLDALLPRFQEETGYVVRVTAVGTGQALELGRRGEADVLLVHAPDAEEQFMAEGNGKVRWLVATNEFVIVGPPDDPAGVRGTQSALACLQRIAAAGAIWVSRDDRSGTDLLEKRLWKEAGIDPSGQPWYVTSGQGMGQTLVLTDQKRAYTLSDRSTYLAFRPRLQLEVLCAGDPKLVNQYHVITVNPEKFPKVNAAGAEALARFLISPEAQQIIARFGADRYGEPLFQPAIELGATPVP